MDKPSDGGARQLEARTLTGVPTDRSRREDVRMILWRAPGLALLTMARVHDGEPAAGRPVDTGVKG